LQVRRNFKMWDGGAHMGFMSFWWILILGVIFALGWLVLRSGRSNGGGGESAEQALKMRYARGEIDRTAYEEMLRALRH